MADAILPIVMGASMPRPRPRFLLREVTNYGKVVWFVRRGKGKRVRIRAPFGTAAFDREYDDAIANVSRNTTTVVKAEVGSLAWLVALYRDTGEWTGLSLATRRQRENILRAVLDKGGQQAAKAITTAGLQQALDNRKDTPAQARHFLETLRPMFAWAARRGLLKADPTAGLKAPRTKTGPGFVMWSEDQMAAYERRWPRGTHERVWLDVLAYTGLRRGDAVRVGKPHVRDGVIRLDTEKTGQVVTLPILPAPQQTLAAGPCGDLTFICGKNGRPLTKESFGNEFRKAGVPGAAHGVRKIAATRAAQNGATVAELEAIFGWRGGRMAALYTREADRVRLAKQSMHKLENITVVINAEKSSALDFSEQHRRRR
jgi:integrase